MPTNNVLGQDGCAGDSDKLKNLLNYSHNFSEKVQKLCDYNHNFLDKLEKLCDYSQIFMEFLKISEEL